MEKQAAIAVTDPPYADASETATRRRTIDARLYENGPDLDGRMFLSDAHIEFLARQVYPFAGKPIILRDQANDRDRERNAVPGLEIRIGTRKATALTGNRLEVVI